MKYRLFCLPNSTDGQEAEVCQLRLGTLVYRPLQSPGRGAGFFCEGKRSVSFLSPYGYARDCRSDHGRFPVSAICMTTSNSDSLFSSETGVNHGIKS